MMFGIPFLWQEVVIGMVALLLGCSLILVLKHIESQVMLSFVYGAAITLISLLVTILTLLLIPNSDFALVYTRAFLMDGVISLVPLMGTAMRLSAMRPMLIQREKEQHLKEKYPDDATPRSP